jgi:hypothetical protein
MAEKPESVVSDLIHECINQLSILRSCEGHQKLHPDHNNDGCQKDMEQAAARLKLAADRIDEEIAKRHTT